MMTRSKATTVALGLAASLAVGAVLPSSQDWVVRTAAPTAERPATGWTAPADTSEASWLPVMGLLLPASHGASLAAGARLTAVEASSPGRLRELEIVDWVTVEAGADLPVVVVVARDVDDGTASGPRPLMRLIVKLQGAGGADHAPPARSGQL